MVRFNISFITYLRQSVLHHIARVPHDSRWKLAPTTTITQRPRYSSPLLSSPLLSRVIRDFPLSVYLSSFLAPFFFSLRFSNVYVHTPTDDVPILSHLLLHSLRFILSFFYLFTQRRRRAQCVPVGLLYTS